MKLCTPCYNGSKVCWQCESGNGKQDLQELPAGALWNSMAKNKKKTTKKAKEEIHEAVKEADNVDANNHSGTHITDAYF